MDWPLAIRPRAAQPIIPDADALRSPLSGAGQIIVQPACLHGLDVLLPGMTFQNAQTAMTWLMAGRRQLVRFPWTNLSGRALANFLVLGWLGRVMTLDVGLLNLTNFTSPGEGVSILHGGRRYLHIVEAVTINTITLATPFRASYNLTSVVSLGAPVIEGAIESAQPEIERIVEGFRFRIREVR